jgi:hypothetical protein
MDILAAHKTVTKLRWRRDIAEVKSLPYGYLSTLKAAGDVWSVIVTNVLKQSTYGCNFRTLLLISTWELQIATIVASNSKPVLSNDDSLIMFRYESYKTSKWQSTLKRP